MAQFTILSDKEIEQIFSGYQIHNIHSSKVLSGGSENTNFLIVADSGKYVLTVCEQKSAQRTRELVHLLEHLDKNDFQTSKIVRNIEGNAVGSWKGKPVMIKHFIEGKIMDDFSLYLVELTGRELGKLHKIAAPEYLPQKLGYGMENFSLLEEYASGSDFHRWLLRIHDYILPFISSKLTISLIHSDLFCDNIIVSNDEKSLKIMDFEEAAAYYRVFDIGMTIIGVCSQEKTINLNKVNSLLKGYLNENNLNETELNSLHAFTVYAGAAMTFWRHKNYNYINPDPSKTDHYLGLKVLVDHLMSIPAERFIGICTDI